MIIKPINPVFFPIIDNYLYFPFAYEPEGICRINIDPTKTDAIIINLSDADKIKYPNQDEILNNCFHPYIIYDLFTDDFGRNYCLNAIGDKILTVYGTIFDKDLNFIKILPNFTYWFDDYMDIMFYLNDNIIIVNDENYCYIYTYDIEKEKYLEFIYNIYTNEKKWYICASGFSTGIYVETNEKRFYQFFFSSWLDDDVPPIISTLYFPNTKSFTINKIYTFDCEYDLSPYASVVVNNYLYLFTADDCLVKLKLKNIYEGSPFYIESIEKVKYITTDPIAYMYNPFVYISSLNKICIFDGDNNRFLFFNTDTLEIDYAYKFDIKINGKDFYIYDISFISTYLENSFTVYLNDGYSHIIILNIPAMFFEKQEKYFTLKLGDIDITLTKDTSINTNEILEDVDAKLNSYLVTKVDKANGDNISSVLPDSVPEGNEVINDFCACLKYDLNIDNCEEYINKLLNFITYYLKELKKIKKCSVTVQQ